MTERRLSGTEKQVPELKLENSLVDDRYQIESCLGRGSYAEIFLAYDQMLDGESVIIKALNTTLRGTLDPDLEWTLIENFQNEALALDKVRHPRVIRRLGHGTAADLSGVAFHYLVLEYMPGGDLLSLCRNTRLGLNEALFYFEQVADALANAHSRGVIHRDIKPNNLLLSEDHKVVKIADFGVAKITLDDSGEITRVGTNVYAPPEHHPEASADDTFEKLTPSADVYSLAKTIYTTLTGRAPRQFSRQCITELPEDLIREPWGPDLLRLFTKATTLRVADRYQSVQEFWKDFVAIAGAHAYDPDATVVRSRLGQGSGDSAQAAAQPNFLPLAGLRPNHIGSQGARIVVNLPHADLLSSELESGSRAGSVAEVGSPSTSLENPSASPNVVAQTTTVTKRAPRDPIITSGEGHWPRSDAITEWLRRAFILFLIAALIGLAASTYYYFAGEDVPLIGRGQSGDGSIAGAANVNLRSDPHRQAEVLGVLPEGTRVRVFESRDGWKRVRVLDGPGNQPGASNDTGWVDARFIRFN